MADMNPKSADRSNPPPQSDGHDIIAELKKSLPTPRVPPELREQILREMPPPEELEQEYRELQKTGGIPAAEFLASLGIADERKQ